MFKVKKLGLCVACMIAVMFLLVVAANAQQPTGPKYKWGLAHHYPEQAEQAKLTVFLADLIEKFSNGQIEITIYPAGSRGSTSEVTSAVQKGDLELAYMAPYPSMNPKYDLISGLPWIVTTLRQTQELYDVGGFLGNYMIKCGEEINLHTLTHLGTTCHSIISTRPVRTIADFKGLKVREFGGKGMFEMWEKVGALPVSMGSGEVYEALRLKTIDAAVGDPKYAVDKKWTEFAKFFVPTNHEPYATAIVMNRKLYQSLPADIRKAIDEASSWHQYAQKGFTRWAYYNGVTEMKKEGVEYINLGTKTVQTFVDRVKPESIWEKTVTKFEGKEFFSKLLAERKRVLENPEY